MDIFKPKLEVLRNAQRRLWHEMASTPRYFVLYGGTGLALQLGHRQSDDFDFFSATRLAHEELLQAVSYLKGSTILQRETNTITCAVDRGGEIKVSFFGGLKLRQVQEPLECEDTKVRVASLLDIAATKLGLIQRRPFYRDYYDIYALLEAGISLVQALSAAKSVHGSIFDPQLSLKALTFFEDGDLQRLPVLVQTRLAEEARKINVDKLPVITPWTNEIK